MKFKVGDLVISIHYPRPSDIMRVIAVDSNIIRLADTHDPGRTWNGVYDRWFVNVSQLTELEKELYGIDTSQIPL